MLTSRSLSPKTYASGSGPMPHRSKAMNQTKRNILTLQIGVGPGAGLTPKASIIMKPRKAAVAVAVIITGS